MPLTLSVDGDRWRAHLRATAQAYGPGLVPVIKGNGYGFGVASLSRRAAWLRVDTVAVGTYAEAPEVLSRFDGDVLVMEPWRPFLPHLIDDRRVIHTVGRISDLTALAEARPGTRVVVEALTSMARHGMVRHDLAAAAQQATDGRLRVAGLALHLPLAGDREPEAEQWAAVLDTSRLETDTLWVSHLAAEQVDRLRDARAGLTVRPRVGTSLWLGDRAAVRARATVLDRHQVSRGERVGYRQRVLPRDGYVLVVSGGTAHGIGLETPNPAGSVRQRATAIARGSLEAAGLALSPFRVEGRQRWFVEPPHMQVSLVFVPGGRAERIPDIGSELDVDVRFTTTRFDRTQLD